jgi:hypothetical protein
VEGSVGAAKSCEILVEACADKIADADWREGQPGNRDCHLSLDRRFEGRVSPLTTRLGHELLG